MSETHVDIGGHRVRVDATQPREDAPTFLLLHGLVDSIGIWDRLAPGLAERGAVVRFDQRGHGASDAPPGPYMREDLAKDAIAVLDAVGVERAILIGHSMGGIVSMATALQAPERVAGLVLLGTASRCNERTAGWYERIAQSGEREGCDGIARSIYGKGAEGKVRGDAQGIAHVTRALASLYDDPLTPKLAAVQCPVLMLVGEKDPMGPRASEIIAEALPAGRGTLEIIDGAGHWIHVQSADVVLGALDRWRAASSSHPSSSQPR